MGFCSAAQHNFLERLGESNSTHQTYPVVCYLEEKVVAPREDQTLVSGEILQKEAVWCGTAGK